MKLVYIFGPGNRKNEGVWAVKYAGDAEDILTIKFRQWINTEYLDRFCEEHHHQIDSMLPIRDLAKMLGNEADYLWYSLFLYGTNAKPGTHLQQLFKPLNNHESNLTVLQLSKASAKKRSPIDPKLRVYAIRIDSNTYVITGGAIKLTRTMAEGEDTSLQFDNMKKVRDWLKDWGVSYPEDLNELL